MFLFLLTGLTIIFSKNSFLGKCGDNLKEPNANFASFFGWFNKILINSVYYFSEFFKILSISEFF